MTTALVVGAGGREHALAWRLAQSPHVDTIICAPGNPGTATLGENRPLDTGDPAAVAALADRVDASLVVVGPEDPLVAGAADAVRARGRACFGPSASAARLEGSKAWMKDVLVAAGVPTARHATFGADDEAAALAYLETFDGLWVVKTDGLAAGKGVVVTESIDEARATVRDYLSGAAFGAAGMTHISQAYAYVGGQLNSAYGNYNPFPAVLGLIPHVLAALGGMSSEGATVINGIVPTSSVATLEQALQILQGIAQYEAACGAGTGNAALAAAASSVATAIGTPPPLSPLSLQVLSNGAKSTGDFAGGGDYNGDGLTNRQEFRLGTNPLRKATGDPAAVNLRVYQPER